MDFVFSCLIEIEKGADRGSSHPLPHLSPRTLAQNVVLISYMPSWEELPSGPHFNRRMLSKFQSTDFTLGLWAAVFLELDSISVCEHTWFLIFWVSLCLYLISLISWLRCLKLAACLNYTHLHLPTARVPGPLHLSSALGAPFISFLWNWATQWHWFSYYECQPPSCPAGKMPCSPWAPDIQCFIVTWRLLKYFLERIINYKLNDY